MTAKRAASQTPLCLKHFRTVGDLAATASDKRTQPGKFNRVLPKASMPT